MWLFSYYNFTASNTSPRMLWYFWDLLFSRKRFTWLLFNIWFITHSVVPKTTWKPIPYINTMRAEKHCPKNKTWHDRGNSRMGCIWCEPWLRKVLTINLTFLSLTNGTIKVVHMTRHSCIIFVLKIQHKNIKSFLISLNCFVWEKRPKFN